MEKDEGSRDQRESHSGPCPPPPLLIVAHAVEDRIPHGSFNKGSEIFVQAASRAAITFTYFERLSHLEVVRESFFVFV